MFRWGFSTSENGDYTMKLQLFPNLSTLVVKLKEVLISDKNCPSCSLCPLSFIPSLLAHGSHAVHLVSWDAFYTVSLSLHCWISLFNFGCGFKLCSKCKELQGIKDNCHKGLNGAQGVKVRMKHILSIEYPYLVFGVFLQHLLGSWVLCTGVWWQKYQIINYLMKPDMNNGPQFIIQLCHSLLLLCFCKDNSWLLSYV